MYAIVQIAGVQMKAAPEVILDVPLLPAEVGEKLEFPDVLLLMSSRHPGLRGPAAVGRLLPGISTCLPPPRQLACCPRGPARL